MARRRTKALRARKAHAAARDDDVLLVRSAESLGRVIGSLQRHLQRGLKPTASTGRDEKAIRPPLPSGKTPDAAERAVSRSAAARRPGAGKGKTTGKAAHARKASGRRRAGRKPSTGRR